LNPSTTISAVKKEVSQETLLGPVHPLREKRIPSRRVKIRLTGMSEKFQNRDPGTSIRKMKEMKEPDWSLAFGGAGW
jgi:hypothetical protein